MIVGNGEDSLSKDEPYLEHIDSKEIKKLVNRLYQDQPDESVESKDAYMPTKKDVTLHSPDTHDHIASEIDKLLGDSTSLDQHAEPTKAPLPEFPATEKPKKIEKPERSDRKKGIFGIFRK